MTATFDDAAIRRYYDDRTAAFVAVGQGKDALHRAAWAPGVASRPQAFRWVEDRIADRLAHDRSPTDSPRSEPHVLDLGCGVGGSLIHLARRRPIRGTGITLSPVQVRLATERIQAAGFGDRVRVLEGTFLDLPADLPPVDLAFAIEAFVHGPDPARFLAQCHRVIRPGGTLAICDDFLGRQVDAAGQRAVERFRRGWHVNTLLEIDALTALARAAGFEPEAPVDLSSYLELGRPRDRLVGALLAVAGWLPLARLDALRGGHALQRCLAHGWIGYHLAWFRRE